MTEKEFAEFRHECVHHSMKLNDECDRQFSLSEWPRWDFDLDAATLTFSQDGLPKVVADIQVIGTTSIEQGNWQWGWANSNLPLQAIYLTEKVRDFGIRESLDQLTKKFVDDDEYLGWELTSIAASLLG